jgi:hypothetical protein
VSKRFWLVFLVAGLACMVLLGANAGPGAGSAGHAESFPMQTPDPSPPTQTIKLIFIHHSCGGNWLADEHGGLGIALSDNNYFVSDTHYG